LRTPPSRGGNGEASPLGQDFIEGFNQPTYRGMRINGVRVQTWSSQRGMSGL
jgi:hypothetical protein